MALTHDDVNKILHIVDNAPHIDEIEIAHGGLQLRIRRGETSGTKPPNHSPPAGGPSIASGAEQSAAPHAGREPVHGNAEIVIRSPVAGTFRRSPAPGHPPFIGTGQMVGAADTMGLVGTANPIAIKPGIHGMVKQIFPEDGELVEFDQILIVLGTELGDRRS